MFFNHHTATILKLSRMPIPILPSQLRFLEGVTFNEEEIEDGSSSDPLVLDLMKYMKPVGVFEIPSQDRTEKEINNLPDRSSLVRVDQGTKPVLENANGVHVSEKTKINYNSNSNKPGVSEDMDFEFDQGLLDLIAEINSDDFLEMEGGFAKQMESGGHLDYGASVPVEEELEEGEIPGF